MEPGFTCRVHLGTRQVALRFRGGTYQALVGHNEGELRVHGGGTQILPSLQAELVGLMMQHGCEGDVTKHAWQGNLQIPFARSQ